MKESVVRYDDSLPPCRPKKRSTQKCPRCYPSPFLYDLSLFFLNIFAEKKILKYKKVTNPHRKRRGSLGILRQWIGLRPDELIDALLVLGRGDPGKSLLGLLVATAGNKGFECLNLNSFFGNLNLNSFFTAET